MCGILEEEVITMLKRKLEEELLKWKHKPDKICLTIKGARQVGKTTSILAFGKENYKSCIYLNFDINPQYCDIFEGSLEVDQILERISLMIPDAKFYPHETLFFLDEIQACPNARTALKPFALDKRFDVISSGSLLGLNYKEVRSYPVGFEKIIEMHSLDFEEFLWALGYDHTICETLKKYFDSQTPVPKAIHEKMLENFRKYMVVGGMPVVVTEFIKTHNFNDVLEKQEIILHSYMDDMAKYASADQRVKVRECFLSIPRQLAKENKKFQYSKIEKGASARKYESSLMWLHDAGIISFAYNLSFPELPLEGNAIDEQFKVYMRDTGLLLAMLEKGTQKDIIDGNMRVYKGAVYENVIAELFTKMGRKLYYYRKDSGMEIAFFIRYDGKCMPIEVKSSQMNQAKSLKTLLTRRDHYHMDTGMKLGEQNVGYMGDILTVPIYMAPLLNKV